MTGLLCANEKEGAEAPPFMQVQSFTSLNASKIKLTSSGCSPW